MTALIDMKGMRFGRLMVLERSGLTRNVHWQTVCDCGSRTIVSGTSLRRGLTKSCGCLSVELAKSRNKANGYGISYKGSGLHSVWLSMIGRCENPKNTSFSRYGAKGITVCEAWHDYEAFISDMGSPEEGQQIDRIDNLGNYEPSNCRWVSRKQNGRNKTNNVLFAYKGEDRTLTEISEISRIPHTTLWARIKNGWDPEKAFSLPPREIAKKGHARPHIRERRKRSE